MGLQLTLDYGLQIVAEPGYYQRISSIEWEKALNVFPGSDAEKSFWSDQATRTIMLMPLQLRPGWLDSADQLDSIVGILDRGTGQLVTNATNVSNFAVYEANLMQNLNNPWVHFSPIPGTTLTFLELLAQIALLALEAKSGFPIHTTDTRVIAYTEEKISGNQAMLLRWYHPPAQIGQSYMGFTIGQFVIICQGDHVQILEDISTDKSRSVFRHVLHAPLFAPGAVGTAANNSPSNRATPSETGPQFRSLLWLPFQRNRVYIESSVGTYALITTKPTPKLNGKPGLQQDWDIVDDKELLVWGYTPSVGMFQIQKVKWAGPDTKQTRIPTFTMDYAPAIALTSANFVTDSDAFRDTSIIAGTPSTPPGYDNIENNMNDCPAVTTDGTATTREYGVTFSFASSTDQRYTPFLYGVDVRIERSVRTWLIGDHAVLDTHASTSRIAHATISSTLGTLGSAKGSNELEVELIDAPPLPLFTSGYYYRTSQPIKLEDTTGPLSLFLGVSEPNRVRPLRLDTTIQRELSIQAIDLWKFLDTPMRDQRDWTGAGHIDVVNYLVQLAGINTAGADYPSPLADWNTPLGGANQSIPALEGALKPIWKAQDQDTYATFVTKIAEAFSGFVIGFYPDGRFYYLPQVPVWYYNTPEGTFYKSRVTNPGGPCYEDGVEFETVECEANCVQVVATNRTGGKLRSATMIDWPSIENVNAPNFIGRRKLVIYPIEGTLTCPEINRLAKVIHTQTRRRHLKMRFRADYVPTWNVGHVATIEGQSGTWRLLSVKADYIRQGWKQAQYEVELVEKGFM